MLVPGGSQRGRQLTCWHYTLPIWSGTLFVRIQWVMMIENVWAWPLSPRDSLLHCSFLTLRFPYPTPGLSLSLSCLNPVPASQQILLKPTWSCPYFKDRPEPVSGIALLTQMGPRKRLVYRSYISCFATCEITYIESQVLAEATPRPHPDWTCSQNVHRNSLK